MSASNGSVASATWQQVELARHPDRPYALDYIHAIFPNFFELHGDRVFGDDHAIIGGPAAFDQRTVMVIAQQKGRTTAERAMRNFGMANPEGYRKALRLIRQAERFGFPILAFVDTSGAFPGAGAEEALHRVAQVDRLRQRRREALDRFGLVVARVEVARRAAAWADEGGRAGDRAARGTGPAGDGSRLDGRCPHMHASRAGDRCRWPHMPEACASILWRDIAKKVEAAEALKLTAADLKRLGLADEIVPEPPGGAQTDYGLAADAAAAALRRQLDQLDEIETDRLVDERYARYRKIGV